MAFPVFFPSLVRFPLFGSCPSLFSFVNSLCLSPFFSLSRPLACWRCGGVFIGQKGAGASLLPPYSSAWGAGLCCPATAPGWLANGWGWQGATSLVFFITRVHGGAALAGRWRVGFNEERRKKLPSPAARPGEGERGTVSFKTTLFCTFFFYMKRRRFMKNASFHLKVAPASFFQTSP